ncbi:3-hydroxybutyryl-CoA dehydrogenase [Micromonospora sp. C31]|uniref:3-hydroxyacyl-CoA dehydrogenase family protein n=1 Tax=Micromonospora sp. C31 TaxID=2824876 RepID=UPI001B3846B6|nr:3-hydroxyacyl-CoA dehydrogenase NAD-binding domain-containing protein [Micromonospora sp. C31]MBQ1076228.1 3-hydroxybutyryl-CoA dehydrogenase [Micromonospora sp. C31]
MSSSGRDNEHQLVGVVGAGVMGVGVAQSLSQNDHRVILVDVSDAVLDRARAELRNNLRTMVLFGGDRSIDIDATLDRVHFTTDYDALGAVDFLVENVTEEWETKREVYRRIDTICKPETVFAVNTSAISITRVGGVTNRPERVVGTHFMNPVPVKPMVEVIRGFHTTDETIDETTRFLAGMGKECTVVQDSPGFVSNRVLMLTINEAIFLVQDGVAEPKAVDRIFRTCFSHQMGPLETADMIGLDTILKSVEVLYESFNDDKYRPAPLLKKMVDAGLHGRKSGRGFYVYR